MHDRPNKPSAAAAVARARARRPSAATSEFVDDAGRVTHLISIGIDVTDERRAEQALHGIEAVGTLLATTGPTPESLTAVLTTLSDRMGYPRLGVYLRRAGRLELRAAVSSNG